MAWYGGVDFEQLVIDFVVAEKQSVTIIYQQLKMYVALVLLIKALSVIGLHKLHVLRKAKWRSVTNAALVSRQQRSLRHCFSMLVKSFETTSRL